MGEAFTLGPWKVCADPAFVDGPDGKVVANCRDSRHPSEEYANAELIAAAPDLYAALAMVDERHGAHCADPLPMDLCTRVEAALSKARGEV